MNIHTLEFGLDVDTNPICEGYGNIEVIPPKANSSVWTVKHSPNDEHQVVKEYPDFVSFMRGMTVSGHDVLVQFYFPAQDKIDWFKERQTKRLKK